MVTLSHCQWRWWGGGRIVDRGGEVAVVVTLSTRRWWGGGCGVVEDGESEDEGLEILKCPCLHVFAYIIISAH